jgi:hypothetical protein
MAKRAVHLGFLLVFMLVFILAFLLVFAAQTGQNLLASSFV